MDSNYYLLVADTCIKVGEVSRLIIAGLMDSHTAGGFSCYIVLSFTILGKTRSKRGQVELVPEEERIKVMGTHEKLKTT